MTGSNETSYNPWTRRPKRSSSIFLDLKGVLTLTAIPFKVLSDPPSWLDSIGFSQWRELVVLGLGIQRYILR